MTTDAAQVQFPGQMAAFPTLGVLAEIVAERQEQDLKFGVQDHPDGTGPLLRLLDDKTWSSRYAADVFRARCEGAAERGQLTWWHVLLEEVFEAGAETNPDRLRHELLQIGAVAAAWIEAIDRRTAR